MEKSSFFNSVSHDRTYKAEDWAEYFASFIGNGVFPVPSSGLQVVADEGMNVTVKTGKAWINGYFYYNTSDLTVTLNTTDGVLNRIDRVVLRWDLTKRNIAITVKSATPSTNPTAPTLQRDADAYEIALADVSLKAGATAIQQSNITDQRFNSALCGIVTGAVEQIDASALTAQFNNFFQLYRNLISDEYSAYVSRITGYENNALSDYEAFVVEMEDYQTSAQADFETWLDGIKGQLSGQIAGQMAAAIQSLKTRVSKLEAAVAKIDVYTSAAWLGNSYLGCAYLSTDDIDTE